MDDLTPSRLARAKLLQTPFFASFVGVARPGEPTDPDPAARAAAWASWAVTNVVEVTGFAEREYAALLLPGRFYDPKGTGPKVRPHLEIPARQLTQPDPSFPHRLAMMGNGLMFPWWVPSEVTAARRALFNTPTTAPGSLLDLLTANRLVLLEALRDLAAVAAPQFSVLEALLVTSQDGLSDSVCGDFSAAEVEGYFPAARNLHLSVSFDVKLREKNGTWASRRVGVWQLTAVDSSGERCALGTVTPRLTANSLFHDPLFSPERESAAALLVRGLVLRRLAAQFLSDRSFAVAPAAKTARDLGVFLRAVPARAGAKLPEASLGAAVNFLQAFPDPAAAWSELESWATRTSSLLTVNKDGFFAAHRNALRYLRRAEQLERDDVNVLLPLAWDDANRVVRVTFARTAES